MQQRRRAVSPDQAICGLILRLLEANRGLEIAMDFETLHDSLDLRGKPTAPHKLRDLLGYMAGKGYVELTRLRDVIGNRLPKSGDASLDHIQTVKLTPKGKDLLDGTIEDDPGIRVVRLEF